MEPIFDPSARGKEGLPEQGLKTVMEAQSMNHEDAVDQL